MRSRLSPDSDTDHRRKTSELTLQQIIMRRLQDMLGSALEPEPGYEAKVLARIEQALDTAINEQGISLSLAEREQLYMEVIDDLLGLGRLAPLMRDEQVSSIYVYDPQHIIVERKGRRTRVESVFEGEAALLRAIDRLLAPVNLHVDAAHPILQTRLPDGWEINIIVPPAALHGPTLTLHCYAGILLSLDELIRLGTVAPPTMDFLRAAVVAGLNILVSGGARAGTTTLLNALVGFIPADVRIIVIEQTPELHPLQDMVVRLVGDTSGCSERMDATGVTIGDLIGNLPYMNGEWFVIGDIRGPEACQLLASVNSGSRPMLATIRADHPRDALRRLEFLAMTHPDARPPVVLRQQIAYGVDLVVQIDRLRDGSRRITAVSEVACQDGDRLVVNDILQFEEIGGSQGRVEGALRATGHMPQIIETIKATGINLDPEFFRP